MRKGKDPNKKPPTKRQKIIWTSFIVICVLMIAVMICGVFGLKKAKLFKDSAKEVKYEKFLEMIDDKKVKDIKWSEDEETITFSDKKDKSYTTANPKYEDFKKDMLEKGIEVKETNGLGKYETPIMMGVQMLMYIILFAIMIKCTGMGSLISPKEAKEAESNVKFKDVAGLQEEKEDLQEIVDFLKEPKKYLQVGARIPKGVLLVGPPGTGKTLLAKAVAGEAGVPFFSISGSDFVEMFVGVGASRVRDMFTEAKLHAPCIIFIDEIDAVARRRGAGVGGGHDEREQTLNQMLVEMDGFGYNEGIIVMAATNRVDILDPAILRPGRFDRKIGVGRPDVRGREEILAVHIKNKPLGEDVDLKEIARTSAGFTGADLENLMNEAAIYAAKAKRAYIMQEDIRRAFIKVGIGEEKKSRIISEKEKKITAYHEAGHAILFHVLPDMGPVHTISVIPTGMGAAGYTMPLPGEDEMFNSKKKMLQNIIVDFGGRVAEELIFGDVTTGASQDIKQATQMARAMVTQYGMSDKVGLIHYGSDDDEVFIGRDLAHTKGYADQTAALIDGEVKNIIDESYAKAKELLQEHMDVLHRCAQLLIEKEKIGREEFESLFGENA